ncbi:MAG: response regulator [Planctomycetota bacterium]
MRFLIFETDVVTRGVLTDVLSSIGTCVTVDNVAEAHRYYRKNDYDLVTIDVDGPAEAIALLERVHQHGGRTLVTTQREDVEHIVSSLRRGGHGYLLKPVTTADELLDQLEKMELATTRRVPSIVAS